MNLIDIVLSNGYARKHYGYTQVTENNTHWVTFFNTGEIEMYAYRTEDSEAEKIYGTGLVKLNSPEELQTLILILVTNHP